MFIVFGWGRQTVKEHGPVLKYHCSHCNNDKHWILYTRRTWFTLFFIPVIPYSTEYLMLCPICKYGVKLEKVKFEEYRAIAQCNMELIHKRITQEEHASRVNQILQPKSDKSIDDMSGKTDTQKNYLRQIREFEEKEAAKAAMTANTVDTADTGTASDEAEGI